MEPYFRREKYYFRGRWFSCGEKCPHSHAVFCPTQDLTVSQIKQIRLLIDQQMKENDQALLDTEAARNDSLREIGNMLHDSCIVSNNEVFFFCCCEIYPW